MEVSSAAGVAAVLSDRMKTLGAGLQKVGVILCGGNTDLDRLPWYPQVQGVDTQGGDKERRKTETGHREEGH